MNLEAYLKGDITYSAKKFKPLIIPKNEGFLKKGNITLRGEHLFSYKNKYLKFARNIFLNDYHIDIEATNIKLTPISDIREEWELIDQWVEDDKE